MESLVKYTEGWNFYKDALEGEWGFGVAVGVD
jgi:hypothetical protein